MSETTENPIREAIAEAIREHDVLLFMKGTPERPACGFSARTVAALDAVGAPFAAVDILPDPRIRQELSGLSNWPTIPQLFVKGELVGGCDIVTEMYETGELFEVMGVEPPSQALPRCRSRTTSSTAPSSHRSRRANAAVAPAPTASTYASA
jgi:monothiol glutaredoxin